ncbi:hypothetical protein SOVF_039530 [Spinacia oleracea]|nr:hypothetical protein SOVF_039530 [Spinacia oleracea]
MGSNHKITAEEVISKLKDDGDFDRLRLKIVRQLKQNEDLRNNIISVVKQSTALNQPGAENMQTRKLCDAIHDEIHEKAMNQISEGLWEIIRSEDGMKTEIKETVHSVYDKLLKPEQKATEGESMFSSAQVPVTGGTDEFNGDVMISGESNGTMSNGEHNNEASDFCLPNHSATNNHDSKSETQQPHQHNGSLLTKGGDSSPPPSTGKHKQTCNANDEDPDIPPGFG